MRNKIVRNRIKVNHGGSQDFAAYIASLHRAVHALDSYFAASLDGELSQAEAVVLLHLGTSETTTINAETAKPAEISLALRVQRILR